MKCLEVDQSNGFSMIWINEKKITETREDTENHTKWYFHIKTNQIPQTTKEMQKQIKRI